MRAARQWAVDVAIFATLLASVGCSISRYHYIALAEVPSLKVDAYDTPKLGKLYFSSEMPSRYSLSREAYRLSFHASLDSYLPEMRISVTSNDGELLKLSERASRKARSDRAVPCGSFGPVAETESELRFSWVTCPKSEADERYISFDVTTQNGVLVKAEDIPFDLTANGFYVLTDLP